VGRNRESSFLIKANPNSTFDILLRRAEREGRVGGKFRCEICGMSFRSEQEAFSCCEVLRKKQVQR
jgi:hypothetical protein